MRASSSTFPRGRILLIALMASVAGWLLVVEPAGAGLLRMQSDLIGCQPQLLKAPNQGTRIVGTLCDDLIVAGPETTEIEAGDGNDLIIGGSSVGSVEAGLGDDTIYSNGSVEVYGGADGDLIFGDNVPDPTTKAGSRFAEALGPFEEALGRLAVESALAEAAAGAETGSKVIGTPTNGDNLLYGEAGNDVIHAMGGNDRVYGNTGDDQLYGENGDDLLAGGHGADTIDGGNGDDTVRGDGTLDYLYGGPGSDTLSFASGVTPGFSQAPPVNLNGFPASASGRGVYVDLTARIADNGIAGDGGGLDSDNQEGTPALTSFENVVGTPFADSIMGDDNANIIDGGGGSDIIFSSGGDDVVNGGAGGDNINSGVGVDRIDGDAGTDYCANGSVNTSCNETGSNWAAVVPSDSSKVAVGFIASDRAGSYPTRYLELYVRGSTGADSAVLTYTYNAGSADKLEIRLNSGTFDTSSGEMTSGCDYSNANGSPKRVTCSFSRILDMVNVSGLGGNDNLTLSSTGFPVGTNVILLGGDGGDTINGSDTGYDVLVDGPGNDTLQGFGKDDGLINNQGVDHLYAGAGSDLLLSTTLCEGDHLGGGGSSGEKNNASWAKLTASFPGGVGASLVTDTFGNRTGSGPACSPGSGVGSLLNIQYLEGSSYRDALTGNDGDNNFLGRNGGDWLKGQGGNDAIKGWTKHVGVSESSDNDTFYGGAGNDTVWARDGFADVSVDCGTGSGDTAYLDWYSIDNFAPVACEDPPRGAAGQ